ncbi:ATPase involved in chromosome partitioning [Mycobacteroides abscessus subsp. abscessus]|uniref:ParA family protein n=1 Tax=Mycobacteroides abscessus TaxID=36809 RepID=UPI00092941C5|nr:ParA family protein [Mycobacteroides abscessus]SIJ22203.1 ATPase involved in chromosome partitioning [Mycobacteroides abscessus subsp. abscessus]SLH38509.1 ATPase involved in chromosome partitioning [Mycobacteroides abscessus subsp. abscessus]
MKKTKVIAILNQKGGPGKSTVTMNSAAVVAEKCSEGLADDAPSPTAVVSVDPQGSATWWAKVIGDDNLPFHLIQAHDDSLDMLRRLNDMAEAGISHVFVDTPGWHELDPDAPGDGLGDSYSAHVMRAVLDVTDEVILPCLTEPLCFDPTERTIRKLIAPRGKKYTVVINNFDPRGGDYWLNETLKFGAKHGWPVAETVLRHYKVHANAPAHRALVPQYKDLVTPTQVETYENLRPKLWATRDKKALRDLEKLIAPPLKAADDFYRFVDELDLAGEK